MTANTKARTRRGAMSLLTAVLVASTAVGMGGCSVPVSDDGGKSVAVSETEVTDASEADTEQTSAGQDATTEPDSEAVPSYTQIDQETAKRMMEADDGHIIVDVRRQDEYDAGHIPGAVLIPNENIGTERPEVLSNLDQVILVYCRSGRRSKEAAQKLADMGYTQVYEFGGINDWTGEVVTEEGTD